MSTVAWSYIIDIRLVDINQSLFVRPVNMLGEGPSSDQINLQTMLTSTLIDAPQLLSAVNVQPTTVLLSWFPPIRSPHGIVS